MAEEAPVTRQVGRPSSWPLAPAEEPPLELREAALRPVVDAAGRERPFGTLFAAHKALLFFVRHFLCYTCKEYVEDLGKIPKKFLEDANVRLIVIGQSTHDHIKHVPCLIRAILQLDWLFS